MANITVKNIPDALYNRLKKTAQMRHRSINNEIIRSIEKTHGVTEVDTDPEQIRALAREFHKKIKVRLSPEEIEAAINWGRP
jgi:plasmid stability protein